MPKKIYVSPDGFASCPQCLSHVRIEDDLDEAVCPFCEESFHLHTGVTEVGSRAFKLLRNSRTGIMAAAFAGAGLTMTVACGDDDDPDPEPPLNINQDYGAFPMEDAGFDEYDAGNDEDADEGDVAEADAETDTDDESDVED